MRLLGYFTLLIAFVGVQCGSLEAMNRVVELTKSYTEMSENLAEAIEGIIRRSRNDSLAFWLTAESLQIVKEGNAIPDSDKCKVEFFNLDDLKSLYKISETQLEDPLLKRISDIQGRISIFSTEITIYQSLSDMRSLRCNSVKEDKIKCLSDTKEWVQESMADIICKIIMDCKVQEKNTKENVLPNPIVSHNISKRSLGYDSCGTNEFACKSGECIDMSSTCNTECNCLDCSDEPSDCNRKCIGEFHCKNLKCLDKTYLCDGNDDCGDGSDEADCWEPTVNCSIDWEGFECRNKKCISLWEVCNGHEDCGDGSDEDGLCLKTDCEAGCSATGGVCLSTPSGSACLSKCPSGTHEAISGWCLPGATLPPSTVAGLIDDTPRVISRYLTSVQLLRRRTMDEITRSFSQFMECKIGKQFPRRNISDFN